VRALYIFASQRAYKLDVVIARNAERLAGQHHAGYETKNLNCPWTTIYKVAYED
jgi:hypothetical protein